MSKTKLGHRGGRRGQAVLLTGAAVFGLGTLVALPSSVSGQSQPPPLSVYSDDFSASDNTAAPGTVQHGTQIAVEVEDLDDLETRTTALEQRLQAHLDDAGAHQPHGHPAHNHNGGPMSAHRTDSPHGHSHLYELLADAIDFLVPFAHAQSQPPALRVYADDMSGPKTTAPTSSRTDLEALLGVDISMIDRMRALITRLNSELTAHVGNADAHPHSHPHTH